MKKFILIPIMLIGIVLTAYPQLSSIKIKIIEGDSCACWTYQDAAILVNTGIKSFEYKERYDNLKLINDSLTLKMLYTDTQLRLSKENIDMFDQIIIKKNQESNNLESSLFMYKEENKKLKTQNKLGAIVLIILGTLLIIK